MRILFEICHPSHVHYFKNLIKNLEENGQEIKILAQNRGIIQKLLQKFHLQYEIFPNLPKNIFGKLLYIPFIDLIFYKKVKKFKPNILLGFAGAYVSHVGWLKRIPAIVLDDTDIANFSHIMYAPLADLIISPYGFKKNFGEKHIFIDTTFDLLYLHPKYFIPNPLVKEELKLDGSKKTIFMRFTSMTANHDWNYKKISYRDKLTLVHSLKDKYKILISSEDELPDELKQFAIDLSPEKIHDALYYSDLFIGESGSMSTEAAILGTPSINIAEAAQEVGVFKRLSDCGIYRIITNMNDAINIAETMINEFSYIENFNRNREIFLKQIINPTDFLVWFIENYPESKSIVKNDSNYQYRFK